MSINTRLPRCHFSVRLRLGFWKKGSLLAVWTAADYRPTECLCNTSLNRLTNKHRGLVLRSVSARPKCSLYPIVLQITSSSGTMFAECPAVYSGLWRLSRNSHHALNVKMATTERTAPQPPELTSFKDMTQKFVSALNLPGGCSVVVLTVVTSEPWL